MAWISIPYSMFCLHGHGHFSFSANFLLQYDD